MSSTPPGQPPSWKAGAAGPQSEPPAPQRPWQQDAGLGEGGRRGFPRWLKIGLVALAFGALAGLFVVVILWLRPPKAPVVVLLSAPNAANIAVPHDVTGQRGLDAAAAAFPDSRIIRRTLTTNKELMARDVWAPLEQLDKDQKVVVFVAAHGAVDQNGPYLLPEGADPADPDNVVYLKDLLDHLKAVPCRQKLLVLDATQVPAFWPLGEAGNDFARAVAADDFKKLVAQDRGLIVLSSSAPDQQSWVSDGRQMSSFSYAVAEGLKGAADEPPTGDGNRHVTVKELHDYASAKVDQWVRANRNAAQKPELIDPNKLAKDMRLRAIDPNQPPAAPEDLATFAPPPELTDLWQAAEEMGRDNPAVYAPHLWRRYLDTALRVEELVRAGDIDDAARARRDFDSLGQQLRDARKLPVGSLSVSLALPTAFGAGLPPQDKERLKQSLDRLWEQKDAKDEDFARLAEEGTKDNGRGLALRQAALTDLLLARVTAHPGTNLTLAAHRLPRFDGPSPAEAEPLPFFAEHARGCPPDTLALALKVRARGERAALGLADEGGPAASEQAYPWVRKNVEDGDAQRRVGEDLLLSRKPGDAEEAKGLLNKADRHYSDAQADARQVRHALVVRADALAELPYYSRWVVERPPTDAEKDMADLEALWGRAHDLDALLGRSPPVPPADLDALAVKVENGLADLRGKFDGKCSELARQAASLQENYHQIDALLRVPFVRAGLRESLLRNLGTVSHDLETPKEGQAAGVDEKEAAEAAQARTERSARAALAVLGRDWLRAEPAPLALEANDLKRAGKEPQDWQTKLDQARDGVRERWRRRLTEANRLSEAARVADTVDGARGSLAALAEAAALARHLDGAGAARLVGDPVDDYRRMQASELFRGLAWRATADDWGGDADVPYFRRVAHEYLDTADALAVPPARARDLGEKQKLARRALVEAERRKIDAVKEPELQWAQRDVARPGDNGAAPEFRSAPEGLELTIDDRVVRDHRVSVPGEIGPAAPVIFGRAGKMLDSLADDGLARALGGPAGDKRAATAPFTYALTLPEGPPPALVKTAYVATGLFRGRVLPLRTEVGAHFVPETVAWRPEAEQGRVAVQATPELHERLALGGGRLAIVLDCSQSMSTPQTVTLDGKSQTVTRFDLAVRALEQVLKEVPPGTRVSLWAFAHYKDGIRYPEEVEKSIECLMKPQAWEDPAKSKQFEDLMAAVRKLQPYSWSPILQAMLEAKADLVGGDRESGYRTLLVLTDGVDNRFQGRVDKDFNPDGKKTIPAVIREQFDKSGIGVKVVGFQLSDKERPTAMQQFGEPIRKLTNPEGAFLPDAERVGDLIDNLRKVLRQRLVYQVLSADGKRRMVIDQTLTRVGTNPAWATLPEPGDYTVEVSAGRPLRQRVHVRLGESLLLKLEKKGDTGLALARVLHGRITDPGTLPPPSQVKTWLLGTWQDRRTDRGELQVVTTLEGTEGLSAPAGQPLEQPRPGLVWFRVSRDEDPAPVHGLRFYPLYTEAAPAWRLEVRDWSAKAAPSVKAWWDTPDMRLRSWELSKSDVTPEPGRWGALVARDPPEETDAQVVARKARWRWEEKRLVRVTPGGKMEEHPCLVVSLECPKDRPFFVRLPDELSAAGQEHNIYPDARRYIGVFWSHDRRLTERLKALTSVSVVSLKEFKDAAEGAGLTRLVSLPPPQ